jgi:prophage regulatory protein
MRILKATEVAGIVSLSVSQIWRLTRQGKFPSPIKLTTCRSGWLEAEVLEWVSERIAGRAGASDQSVNKDDTYSGE